MDAVFSPVFALKGQDVGHAVEERSSVTLRLSEQAFARHLNLSHGLSADLQINIKIGK